MKDALKLALMAAGGYLLYRYFVAGSAIDGASAGNSTAGPSVRDLVWAAAGKPATLSFDQWNYYYAQVAGKPGPAPEEVGITRIDPMPQITVDQWYQALQDAGLAGVTLGGYIPAWLAGCGGFGCP